MDKNTLKGIGSVAAGFLVVLILSVATDAVLERVGVFPPQSDPGSYTWWMLLVALMYRSLYAVLGGYVTAALAPGRPMRYAIILGIIGFAVGTLGSIVNWDKTSGSNAWYPVALIVLTLPSVWLGGKWKISHLT